MPAQTRPTTAARMKTTGFAEWRGWTADVSYEELVTAGTGWLTLDGQIHLLGEESHGRDARRLIDQNTGDTTLARADSQDAIDALVRVTGVCRIWAQPEGDDGPIMGAEVHQYLSEAQRRTLRTIYARMHKDYGQVGFSYDILEAETGKILGAGQMITELLALLDARARDRTR